MTGEPIVPGEIISEPGRISLNVGRDTVGLIVENTGDRPVQVGSHYHFAATNPALRFDRVAAHGFRLDIPAGTSVRFEPGLSREVALVALAGRRIVPGLRLEYAGPLDVRPAEPTGDTAVPNPTNAVRADAVRADAVPDDGGKP